MTFFLVIYRKNYPHPSHFKEKFPPEIFPKTFLVIIYQTKISFHPMFWDFYTFLLFLAKRSRKVPVRHDSLYDTAILT